MAHLPRFPWLALAAAAFAATASADPVDWSAFRKSIEISFPNYSGETLTDFPVLVRLSAARSSFQYAKCRLPNGEDLRFSDANGNLIPSEIDTWNPDGESLVWVKVPSLNKTTTITAYYGCDNPPAMTPSDVWSNGYLGVWHMGDSASPLKASTPGAVEFTTFTAGNYETINGIQWAQTGIVGRATKFGPHAIYTNSILRTTSDDAHAYEGLDALTVEAWACRDTDAQNTGYILDLTQHTGTNWAWRLFDYKQSGVAKVFCSVCTTNGTEIKLSGSTVSTNQWMYRAFTYNSQIENAHNFFLYVNGQKSTSKEDGGGSPVKKTKTGRLFLGNQLSYNHYTDPYPGRIDEVRISNVARSADWVKATYDTVKNEDFAFYHGPNDWKKYSHTFSVSFPGATNGILTAFPALVKVSESLIPGFDYADCRKPNGGDLRFADEDGRLLDSEVDTWNPSGESFVWVSLPTLTNNATIKAYYGWAFAPNVNSANVWTNGYVGVWHMGGELPLKDSVNGETSLNENVAGATLPGQAGLAGNAIAFNQLSSHKGGLETTDQRYRTSGKTEFTVEFWSYQDSFNPTSPPYSATYMQEKGSETVWRAYDIQSTKVGSNGKTVVQVKLASGSNDNPSTGNRYPNRAEWVYQNFRLSNTSQFYQGLYQDKYRNSKIYTKNYSSSGGITNDTANTTLSIGSSGSNAFPGMIDEVRISSVARSDDWMNATYDTIKNASTFATYSPAKENSEGTVLIFR